MIDGGVSHTDVLVVGAGPTGLLLGIELARRGVRVRVVERQPQRSPWSRALVVQARSLEIFEQLGLVEQFLAVGRRNDHARIHAERRVVAEVTLTNLAGEGAPYPFILAVSQAETERILEAHLQSLDVTIERPVELVALAQDRLGIKATVRSAAGEERIRAKYVVGCDGAHSAVRHLLDVPFEGARYEQDFVLADLDIAWDCPRDGIQIFVGKEGTLAAFPLWEEKRWRLIASRHDVRADAPEPQLSEFEEIVRRLAPYPATLSNPLWITRFRLHHRIARSYAVGRAFLAGDAAHIHSPAGGQGMNTGLQDAWNLGWKLAQAVRGHAGEALLASYEEERRPVGQRLLKTTDRLFEMATSTGPAIAFARRHVLPHVAAFLSDHESLRRSALHTVTQLGIRYRGSPIVREPPTARELLPGGPHAGDRAPDGTLLAPDGAPTRLFLALRGTGHHLVLFAAGRLTAELAEQARLALNQLPAEVPLLVVTREAAPSCWVDPSGALHERFGAALPCHVLVRPDGHLAWRAPGWDVEGARRHLEAVLTSSQFSVVSRQ